MRLITVTLFIATLMPMTACSAKQQQILKEVSAGTTEICNFLDGTCGEEQNKADQKAIQLCDHYKGVCKKTKDSLDVLIND